MLFRFGDDLLSHVLRRSTIGATVLNFRVRDGIGCFTCAMITKPEKHPSPFGLFQVRYTFWDVRLLMWKPMIFVIWLLLDQIKPIGPLVPVN